MYLNEIESLASIHRYTNTEWKNLNYGSDIPVAYDILSHDSDLIFALLYTSDVNYNFENESSVKKYKDMTNDLKNKRFTFEILENKKFKSFEKELVSIIQTLHRTNF